MYAWGDNSVGQLGLEVSKETKRMGFTLINPGLEKGDYIVDIESGWGHLLLLTGRMKMF